MLEKEKRICTFLVIVLQAMNWVSATASYDGLHHQQDTGQILNSPQVVLESKQRLGIMERAEKYEYKMLARLGSMPPNCDHKCGGCIPCNAIQVPTTSHLGVQYANYEPEGWKCKCGNSFFNP